MISVIGGYYREYCKSVGWDAFYGSGFRAACAVSTLGSKTDFHTCLAESDISHLKRGAAALKISVKSIAKRSNSICFSYLHPMASPQHNFNNEDIIDPNSAVEIATENCVLFSFLEYNPRTVSNRLVYDPQAGQLAQSVDRTRHKFNEMALVLNKKEARRLAEIKGIRENNSEKLADILLKSEGASIVVVKDGPYGACIASSNGNTRIPVFETSQVFPIGSGDVFTATFAKFWCVDKMTPEDSAYRASAATAYYCDTKLYATPEILSNLFFDEQVPFKAPGCVPDISPLIYNATKTIKKKSVYLASSFRRLSDQWLVTEIRDILYSDDLDIFSPWHDVGVGSINESKKIASEDLAGLTNSDVIFAVIDSRGIGTMFEVGYGSAKGKKVIVFCEDTSPRHLLMLIGTDCIICDNIATAIYKTFWALLK